jgi:hypothetical protein
MPGVGRDVARPPPARWSPHEQALAVRPPAGAGCSRRARPLVVRPEGQADQGCDAQPDRGRSHPGCREVTVASTRGPRPCRDLGASRSVNSTARQSRLEPSSLNCGAAARRVYAGRHGRHGGSQRADRPDPRGRTDRGRHRAALDANARLGVPAHVTVLFAFLPPARIDDGLLTDLRALFAEQSAFEVRFSSVSGFDRDVLWLAPEAGRARGHADDPARGRWPLVTARFLPPGVAAGR